MVATWRNRIIRKISLLHLYEKYCDVFKDGTRLCDKSEWELLCPKIPNYGFIQPEIMALENVK